jgi:hypothetical protein
VVSVTILHGEPQGRTWKCQRQRGGVKCGWLNGARKKKCEKCGGLRPRKRVSAAKRAHETERDSISYEEAIRLNGGEHCGICGTTDRGPAGRRFHRDHDHRTGAFRGLLCFPCNSALRPYQTLEWLRSGVAYLERAEARRIGTLIDFSSLRDE